MECENVKGKVADQGEEFFVTGLEKYLDAVSAVTMFEKEVQQRVKKVVARHQPALTKLFGGDWRLRDYSETGTGSPADWKGLGQKVVFKGFGELFFYFYFGRDEVAEPCLIPCALFWRERVTLLSRLWTSAEAIRAPKPEVDNSRISLERSVPSNDWASCEKALSAVIRDWIKLWQKLGGLPKYLPRKAR
jgi:hypothetical protein